MAFNYDSTWISTESAPQQRLSNISDNLLSYLANSRDKVRLIFDLSGIGFINIL